MRSSTVGRDRAPLARAPLIRRRVHSRDDGGAITFVLRAGSRRAIALATRRSCGWSEAAPASSADFCFKPRCGRSGSATHMSAPATNQQSRPRPGGGWSRSRAGVSYEVEPLPLLEKAGVRAVACAWPKGEPRRARSPPAGSLNLSDERVRWRGPSGRASCACAEALRLSVVRRPCGRRSAALLVLALRAAPTRRVAARRPWDRVPRGEAISGERGSRVFGLLAALLAPGRVLVDEDRCDGPYLHAVRAHPLDVAVNATAVLGVRHVRPILRQIWPALNGSLVLASREPRERDRDLLAVPVAGRERSVARRNGIV